MLVKSTTPILLPLARWLTKIGSRQITAAVLIPAMTTNNTITVMSVLSQGRAANVEEGKAFDVHAHEGRARFLAQAAERFRSKRNNIRNIRMNLRCEGHAFCTSNTETSTFPAGTYPVLSKATTAAK